MQKNILAIVKLLKVCIKPVKKLG